MDFENVFWLFLLVAYLVFQVLGKKRRQKKPLPLPEGEVPPARTEKRHTLEEALREIRQALGAETPRHTPEPALALPKKTAPRARASSPKPSPLPGPANAVPSFLGRPTPQPIPVSRLRKHLRETDSAREAILLTEVLGAPLSRRRR